MAEDRLLQALFHENENIKYVALIEKMPPLYKERCQKALQSSPAITMKEVFFDPFSSLSMVDSSWYGEIISATPQSLHKCYKDLFKGKFGSLEHDRTPLVDFLLYRLVHNWKDHTKPRYETLSSHPFFWMLTLSKEQIEKMISLLGVYDIVEVVRKIVDKKRLETVLLSLSASQQQFLRSLLLQKNTNGSEKKSPYLEILRSGLDAALQFVHDSGMNQFCSVVAAQDELFRWHFFHRMHKSYADTLLLNMEKVHYEAPHSVIEQRVTKVFTFL